MAIFRGKRYGALAGLALVVALGLAACGTTGVGGAYGGGSTATAGGTSSAAGVSLKCAAGATVCTKTVTVNGKSETVLADTKGLTLYYFTPDSATTVACTGSCAQKWPPLTTTSGSVSGTGLSGALTVVNGADGAQVEYNGHPLYRYAADKETSDAYGEGVLGKWFVATPTLAAGATPAATPSYGY